MKKIISIIVLIFLFSNNTKASQTNALSNRILAFDEWLTKNGHDQYLDKSKLIEMKDVLNLDEPPKIEKTCEKCAYLEGGKKF